MLDAISHSHEADPYPIHPLLSSAGSDWRNVLAQTAREDRVATAFTTRPIADLLVVVVTSGTYRIESSQGVHWTHAQYHPGSIGLTAPGRSSTLRWAATGQDPLESVHIRLPASLLRTTIDDLDAGPAFEFPDALQFDDPFVAAVGRAMGAALAARAPALYADSLAQTLAAHLVSMTSAVRRGSPARPGASAPGLGEAALRRVLDHMHDNLGNEVTLADLASLTNLSPFHFLRTFRQATGSTPHSYLVGLRVRHGAELLRATALPVAQIAAACGYRSTGNFSAAFRKQFDVSPGRYRSASIA